MDQQDKRRIMILGTGSAQKDIIRYCRDRGFFVVATSNVSGYSAEKIADRFYQTDIVDIEATEKLALDEKVDMIYSVGSDIAMPTIARVSHDLGLPCFFDYETALICNRKDLLRNRMKDSALLNTIPYQIICDPDEKIEIELPAMMKPSDSQGQRGVRRVENIDDIKKYFNETVSFSRQKKIVIEKYIEGDEISVNAFLQDGKILFYLMSDRISWDEYPGGIIHKHHIPSKYADDASISAKIKQMVISSLEMIGLKDGPVYFQIKIDKEGVPYLIEMTPRLDGCHMWRAIKYSTGVDLLEASLDLLQRKDYHQPLKYTTEPYTLEFLCEKPGSSFSIQNHMIPENVYLELYYGEGQKVNRVNGYIEKCGYMIRKGNER